MTTWDWIMVVCMSLVLSVGYGLIGFILGFIFIPFWLLVVLAPFLAIFTVLKYKKIIS